MKHSHRLGNALLLALSLSASPSMAEQKGPVEKGAAAVKKTGKAIGHTSRDLSRGVGHATRDTSKAVGHATRDVFRDIKKGFKSQD